MSNSFGLCEVLLGYVKFFCSARMMKHVDIFYFWVERWTRKAEKGFCRDFAAFFYEFSALLTFILFFAGDTGVLIYPSHSTPAPFHH
jgi:hypothetical protein